MKEVVRDLYKNISGKMQQVKPFCYNNSKTIYQGHVLARYLHNQDASRCPDIIRQLNEDLELAHETLRVYVRNFNFRFLTLIEALRTFLEVLWPEDEPQIQHQFITHFSNRYLQCTRQPLSLQVDLYYMSWAIIKLNADLNGNHKGRKRTWEEFIVDLKKVNCFSQYSLEDWNDVYESIKRRPLKMFRVTARCQAADKKEMEKATEQEKAASGTMDHEEVASGVTEAEDQMQEGNLFRKWKKNQEEAEVFGRHLFYRKEFRCPENIRLLSEDLEFANASVKAYVSHFKSSTCLNKDFRWFLSVFWPEDEPVLQHLLVKHFTRQYLACSEKSLKFQPEIYYLYWNMIKLNADLNGGHKGRKMTCEEFIAKLSSATDFQLPLKVMREVYESIKTQPLTFFSVRTRRQASKPQDSGSNSSFGTENNLTTSVYKEGNLVCKRVMDENERKTKRGQRAWKPFTAVLKGMVLHLEQDRDSKHAIRLHHAMAYPIHHKKRPHALCLRTADSRLFYFQAESEVEQASWVAIINRIAARYSAPPLTSASHDINAYCPQFLPSFPTTSTLEQQLESHKDQLKRVLDHEVQEKQRYVIYVKALQEFVAEKASVTQCKG